MSEPEFGLPPYITKAIRKILATGPKVCKAVILGSRAKGNYRPGSDIDLALVGAGLDLDAFGRLSARLDESPIPYQVDLCLYKLFDQPDLREHIDLVGKVCYERRTCPA